MIRILFTLWLVATVSVIAEETQPLPSNQSSIEGSPSQPRLAELPEGGLLESSAVAIAAPVDTTNAEPVVDSVAVKPKPANVKASVTQKTREVSISPKRVRVATLQIFLDRRAFGPGVIDGKVGSFTEHAVALYSKTHDVSSESKLYRMAEKETPKPLISVIVPQASEKFVDTKFLYGDDREYQSSRKNMPYRSVAEFMAERYHTTVEFLIHLNGKFKVNNAYSGVPLLVPNIAPFKIEEMSQGRGFGKHPTLSARWAVVDTDERQIRIYEPLSIHPPQPKKKGLFKFFRKKKVYNLTYGSPDLKVDLTAADEVNATLIASFPITPGQPQYIRRGTWKMKNSVQFPTWRFDDALLKTGKHSNEGLIIPSGPNSPVGVHWMGLSRKGIGIHGTDNPKKIGRGRSSGCVRMANWDAARMPTILRPGAVVIIK